ncbi:caspase-10 isoform X1 [Microcaecilia unicolor]|uniref:Caspase-8 n=1 Tax=Microcaecilia unicolor TaxID=1415580 RepID=A0A6P7YM70_9AMPH|nr:caspase-10-like isoform X1 [Microcaecilia unicolor]XP_030066117.1 caspase-10-like isoform X1 [Microcaecilia unicolor]XP_030066118.1 caspase-10-like isoform X1 [Microcaecilia unicolor]
MAFRKQLLAIDQELGYEDVEALKFLCIDLISAKKLQEVQSAQKIFQLLIDEGLLSNEDYFLVLELLYIIRQYSLLRKLNSTKEEVQVMLCTRGTVPAYRQMLYELSENITSDDQKSILFLLMDKLPRNQANDMSTLQMLALMEKRDIFSENKLENLETVCANISPDLVKRIARYKWEKGSASFPCQETSSHKPSALKRQGPEIFNPPVPFPTYGCNSEVAESSCEHTGTVLHLAEEGDKAKNVTSQIPHLSLDDVPQEASLGSSFYKMNRQSRGRCLVINNIQFMKHRDRQGSEKDADDLKKVFTWLGLEVEVAVNLNATEIHEIIKNYGNMDYTNHDCFVCCILSHGESGQIIGTNEDIISIHEITSYFTALKCPSLIDKPKLFFIQACRGQSYQCGVYVDVDAINPQNSDHQNVSLSESIPHDADFLLGMATVDGYSAFRDVTEGTWYIQALCTNLMQMVPRRQDILSILTKVNEDVSRKSHKSGWKQMPQPAYTLRKKLVFPVPNTASLSHKLHDRTN